jgi:predicted SAM-dependent methyltransferase
MTETRIGGSSQRVLVNLGCGNTFIKSKEWRNFDFLPFDKSITKIRLSEPLPLKDKSVDLVYLSHVLEHIPFFDSERLLSECHRVLRPQGTIRIVVPEFIEMLSTYITLINAGELDSAKFVKVEIIDQCVRQVSGGQLKNWYERARNDFSLAQFIRERNGHVTPLVKSSNMQSVHRYPNFSVPKVVRWAQRRYFLTLSRLMPSSYRYSLVSEAHIGELHKWIYDYYELQEMLAKLGFTDIEKMSASASKFCGFPLVPLDMDSNGHIKKGNESMFVEAIRV